MIRHEQLLRFFRKELLNEVNITIDPRKDAGLLPPLSEILPPLYEANEPVHRFQISVNQKRNVPLQELIALNSVMLPAEEATRLLVEEGLNFTTYQTIAAKVTDAGDKLDSLVSKEIVHIGRSFDYESTKANRWKESQGLDSIRQIRRNLDGQAETFFSLISVYHSRNLPDKKVRSIKRKFDDYSSRRNSMSRISGSLNSLVKKYVSIGYVSDLRSFNNDQGKRLKDGLFSKGELVRECIQSGYKEGRAEIRSLRAEINYVLRNFHEVNEYRNSVYNSTSCLKTASEQLSQSKEGTSLDSLNLIAKMYISGQMEEHNTDLKHHPAKLFLEEAILDYRKESLSFKGLVYSTILDDSAKSSSGFPKTNNLEQDLSYLREQRSALCTILNSELDLPSEVYKAVESWKGTTTSYIKELEVTKEKKDEIESDIDTSSENLQTATELLHSIQNTGIEGKVDSVRELRPKYSPNSYDLWKDNPYLARTVAEYTQITSQLDITVKTAMVTVIREYDKQIASLEKQVEL